MGSHPIIKGRDNAYSLLELNQFIRRIIALNFEDAIWVAAEISQSTNRRGHRYLQLIQKEEGESQEIIAQIDAVLWAGDFMQIERRLGSEADKILAAGIQVLLKGTISFHERFGLKFRIIDLDENFTRGALDIHLEKLIRQLQDEGLTELNKQIPIPSVLRNIAVITSPKAAGWEDFKKIIHENPYQLYFNISLYECSMQGENVQNDIITALQTINENQAKYDAVVIVRGGGSKIDLADFNNYLICKQISTTSIPVFTGIGHEIDTTAVDFVSALHFNTPTAVAAWLVDYNLAALNEILELKSKIYNTVSQINLHHKNQLQFLKIEIFHQSQRVIQLCRHENSLLNQKIINAAINQLEKQRQWLKRVMILIDSFEPDTIFRKGYALLIQNRIQIKNISSLDRRQKLTIRMADGEAEVIFPEYQ